MKQKRRHSDEEKAKIKASKKETARRHASMAVRVFELKINSKRLNKKQKEELEMMFLEGKRFYNFVLSEKKRREVRLNDIVPTDIYEVISLDKDKNKITHELKYLPSHYKQTIHARMISNEKTIRSLVKRGYQERGSLKFKSDLVCIPLKNMDWSFRSFSKVKIMGVSGKVHVRGADQVQEYCEFANANLLRRADGFFLKITCYMSKDKILEKTEKNGKEIGLDFGIKTNITTSEGKMFNTYVQESDRLKKLQRQLFRRKKGSKNRCKTIKLIGIEYQKMENKKQDLANKVFHELRQYSRIYMQDENLSGWHQSEDKTIRSDVHHSFMGKVKAKLIQLPQTVVLDRFIPTTKLCTECGTVNKHITLSDRVFKCGCGCEEDRDIHAAKNMIKIAKSCFENGFVPPEQREITLMEFETSAGCSNAAGKSGR